MLEEGYLLGKYVAKEDELIECILEPLFSL